jgi:fructose-1,6-bisphosphatase/inositol monophosphatase family enzyme
LAKQVAVTRTWGDAFGHSLVALGQAEAMVDPVVKRWDISAMQLIVEEAGGRMTAFDGSGNPQDQAVSTNGLLHEKILSAFSS